MRFGIDLGGTKIEIIALHDNGDIVYRQRVDTPQGDYYKTVQSIVDLLAQARHFLIERAILSEWDVRNISIGIGMPGAVSHKTGRIKNANSVCLIDKPLQADLELRLQQPIRLDNDANCMAISEATDGAAMGCAIVFGVILGTGTGGGIVIHQQALSGANAIAGEWGHNPMPGYSAADGAPQTCYCGRQNCLETFLSGPGMLHRYRTAGGQAGSVQDLLSQANAGVQAAELFLQQYEQWLARGLASVINIIDPDAIVLAGGLSNMDRLYQNVPQIWSRYVFSDQVNTRLLKAKHGDSSGVRGAAWLWPV